MVCNSGYCVTEIELNQEVSDNKNKINEEKVYNYDEAMELSGNGWYNVGYLWTIILAYFSMGVDLFSISVVVTGNQCDFGLTLAQKTILFSMPFFGPIVMAYPWGYISDTRGRKKSLYMAMWACFVVSIVQIFAPNWQFLAFCKFLSTCFSTCTQSTSYVLLGESCTEKYKGRYMLYLSSLQSFSFPFYFVVGYFILNLEFSYDLWFITFTPWRLLLSILSLPFALSALCLTFFYESPRFLANVGKEDEALEVLKKICKRNGGNWREYPVKKLVLNEVGNIENRNVTFLQSLKQQIVPVFKPPLLTKSLILLYLVSITYGCVNSLILWFPYISNAFFREISSSVSYENRTQGLCNMIQNSHSRTSEYKEACSPKIELETMLASLIQGVVCPVANLSISRFSHKKKVLVISILSLTGLSGLCMVLIENNIANFVLIFGALLPKIVMGLLLSYCVEIYPTSFRSMISCIASILSRISAMIFTNIVGTFVMSQCHYTFYVWVAVIFSGAIVASYLPPDKKNK